MLRDRMQLQSQRIILVTSIALLIVLSAVLRVSAWTQPQAPPPPPPWTPPVNPPPPALPAIGSFFDPMDTALATGAIRGGLWGWPGPVLSCFPWMEIHRPSPGTWIVSDPFPEVCTYGPTWRVDAWVIRTPLNFLWPPGGGKLWLQFGANPMGDFRIIQGPRNLAGWVLVPTVWTGNFWYNCCIPV
ncbi:MAG: hypothetical protein ACE5KJ_01890, partial [Candidatus Zixiibacteriota bacterium]